MQISIVITIGSIIIDSSHGRISSSPGRTHIVSRWRGSMNPLTSAAGVVTTSLTLTGSESSWYTSSSSSVLSSSIMRVMTCTRGGSIENDAQQQPRRRGDDRLAPRRSSSPLDRYGDQNERDRRHRSGPRSSTREVDARGPPPPPRSDRKVGDMGPIPSRQGQRDNDRDRRYNRLDNNNMAGEIDSQWHERDRSRVARNRRGQGNPSPAAASSSAKRKSWFTSSKNDRGKIPLKDGGTAYERRSVDAWDGNVSPFPPPPPPPPPPPLPTTTTTFDETSLSSRDINPAQTDRVPIHYMFPTADIAAVVRQTSDVPMNDHEINAEQSGVMDDTLDVPFLEVEDEFVDGSNVRRRRIKDDDKDEDVLQYKRASPRKDAVTIFMSTRRGALKVRVGSIIVGAAIGGFIGKSLTNDPITMAVVMSSLLFVTGFLRNDYGELSRALGLAFVLTLGRTTAVRKDYPTLPHLKAMIRQGPRKPFPPVDDGDSPWRYEPIYRDDPEFKMTYALLAMSCVGSFCGGNVPIIPAWIGGIVGAAVFASMTTGANARGDLGRTMGMRLVGLIQVVLAINSELRILGKAATVGGLIFDKVMIMDRKHRIKDKIVAICKWGYDKVSQTAEQVKEDLQDERPLRR